MESDFCNNAQQTLGGEMSSLGEIEQCLSLGSHLILEHLRADRAPVDPSFFYRLLDGVGQLSTGPEFSL